MGFTFVPIGADIRLLVKGCDKECQQNLAHGKQYRMFMRIGKASAGGDGFPPV